MNYTVTIILILLSSFHATNCMDKPQKTSYATSLVIGGIEKNFVSQVKIGISWGADVNHIIKSGDTFCFRGLGKNLLQLACEENNEQIVECLLTAGADVDAFQSTTDPALLIAVEKKNPAIIKLLLACKRNINICTQFNEAALHRACTNNYQEGIKELLNHPDININQLNYTQQTAMHIACEMGNEAIVKLFLASCHDIDSALFKSIMIAYQKKYMHITKLILANNPLVANIGDYQGNNLTHYACKHGNEEIVKELLSYPNIDFNMRNEQGTTPLMYASSREPTTVVKHILKRKGIDLNIQTHSSKYTALHLACEIGNENIVKLLLRSINNANITLLNETGYTAMHIAYRKNHTNLVFLILTLRPEAINIQNQQGQTIAYCACEKGDGETLKKLLLCNDIDINIPDKSGKTPLVIACNNKHLALVPLLLENKNTNITKAAINIIAYRAAEKGDEKIIKMLLDNKHINISAPDNRGTAPLHHACGAGHKKCVELLFAAYKHTINNQNYEGDTALHCACSMKRFDIINFLIQNNACVTTKNNRGCTPLIVLYSIMDDNFAPIDPSMLNHTIEATDEHANTQLHLCTTIANPMVNKLDAYLSFLVSHGLSPLSKNKNGKTATELACQEYDALYNSYRTNKKNSLKTMLDEQERIMHSFLRIISPPRQCALLIETLNKQQSENKVMSLIPEITGQIARYYYELNVETIVAKKYHNNQNYYDDFIENKEKIRNELLAKPQPQLLWNT